MLLMDEKPYHRITVSDITEKAGIARQTFYRNYNDKDDVIFEYLNNMLKTDLLKMENNGKRNNIVLTFNYNYMIKHRDNLKKILSVADIQERIFHAIREFPLSLIERYKETFSSDEYIICRYKLCYQIIGCLKILFDWFINDMPMPVDKIVSMLNAMNTPKAMQYRNIPNIIISI